MRLNLKSAKQKESGIVSEMGKENLLKESNLKFDFDEEVLNRSLADDSILVYNSDLFDIKRT